MISAKRFFNSRFQNILLRGFSSSANIVENKPKLSSSLYISSRDESFSVVRPEYDSDYLKHVASCLGDIQNNMRVRHIDGHEFDVECTKQNILAFAEEAVKLKKVKRKRNKLMQMIKRKSSDSSLATEFDECKADLKAIRERFYDLEDVVVPFLLNIPAPIDTEKAGRVIDESKGSLSREEASKLGAVNYLRLGYFNNALQPSIVGPDAHFMTGEGAQTFHALNEYFLELFENSGFEQMTGMDLVKSAIVEAVGSKFYEEDQFRLNEHEPDDFQHVHLTGEASLSALVGSLVGQTEVKPCKIVQIGSSYGDALSQTHTISATILEPESSLSTAQESLYKLWWNALNHIGFRCRSFYAPIEALKPNESSKIVITAWLYSRREWRPIVEINEHSTDILRRAHIHTELGVIHSSLNILPTMQCLLEHFQDANTGKVRRPEALKEYFLSLEK